MRLALANAYELGGRGPEAATQTVQAADLLPDDVDVQLVAGRRLLGQSRFVDAVDRLSPFLRDHPDNVAALLILGNAKARLVNSTWALVKLADAVLDGQLRRRAPRGQTAHHGGGRRGGRGDASQSALGLAPSMREAQLAVVNFLWAAGRPDDGEGLLKEVADRNPGYELANRALGELYLSRGRDGRGRTVLEARSGERKGRRQRAFRAGRLLHQRQNATTRRGRCSAACSPPTTPPAPSRCDGRASTSATASAIRPSAASTRLLARDPVNRPARLLQAQFAVAMKDWDRALPFARDRGVAGSEIERGAIGAGPGAVRHRRSGERVGSAGRGGSPGSGWSGIAAAAGPAQTRTRTPAGCACSTRRKPCARIRTIGARPSFW